MSIYFNSAELFERELNKTKREALKQKEADIKRAKNEIIDSYIKTHGERLDFKKRQELRGLLQEPERKTKGDIKKEILINNDVEMVDKSKVAKLGKKRHTIVVYGEADLNKRVNDYYFYSENKKADNIKDARLEYMEKNILMLNENLRSLTKTYGKQLNAEPRKGAILHKRSVNRLRLAYNKYIEYCKTTDDIESIFWAGQKYLELAYNGSLDKVTSYTTFLLLEYTDLSLSEVERLTGVSSSSLSRVRSRKRWEDLHEPWFLTDREKAQAYKEFKAVAEKLADNYDLTLTRPVKNKISKKK